METDVLMTTIIPTKPNSLNNIKYGKREIKSAKTYKKWSQKGQKPNFIYIELMKARI